MQEYKITQKTKKKKFLIIVFNYDCLQKVKDIIIGLHA